MGSPSRVRAASVCGLRATLGRRRQRPRGHKPWRAVLCRPGRLWESSLSAEELSSPQRRQRHLKFWFCLAVVRLRAPPELGLLWRPADLGDDRRRCQRNNAKFQTGLVFSPRRSIVSIPRHENGSVVDNGAHAGRRTFRDIRSCSRTLRRASIISSALKGPCCLSHAATAAKPARRCSASRAAPVIRPRR